MSVLLKSPLKRKELTHSDPVNDPAGVDPTKMVTGDGQVVFMYNYVRRLCVKLSPRSVSCHLDQETYA